MDQGNTNWIGVSAAARIAREVTGKSTISRQTIYNWITTGKNGTRLKATTTFATTNIKEEDLRAFLRHTQ